MKFQIPAIVKPIALCEYAPEYGERKIYVWVNPPKRLMDAHDDVVRDIDQVRGKIRRKLAELVLEAESAPPAPVDGGEESPLRPTATSPISENGNGGGNAVPDLKALLADETAEMERTADRLVDVFAELWSAGGEPHFTADEVRELVLETAESDPQLWPWLRDQSIDLIQEHRKKIKKN